MREYPEYILVYLRNREGMDEDDTSRDTEFYSMDPRDVFDEVCNWKGFIGWSSTISTWVEDIFGVVL